MQLSSWKGQVPPLKQGFRAQSTVNHRQRISILQRCVHDKGINHVVEKKKNFYFILTTVTYKTRVRSLGPRT